MNEDKINETRKFNESKYRSIIIKELKKKKGKSTLSDVVVATGLPREWVDYTLKKMMIAFKGHFSVTENGELIYDFDPKFHRRITSLEKLKNTGKTIAKAAWKVFVFLFKIWIMITLIAYFVIFVTLLLALFFAQFAVGGKNNKRRGGMIFPIHSIFRLFLIWDFWSRDKIYYDNRYPKSFQRTKKRKDKRLHEKIFAFVFGENKRKIDPLESEKETLNFIRQNKGRLVASDLVALHGYNFDKAEQEAVRLIANYEGDVQATEAGNVLYTFDKLMISAENQTNTRNFSYCWEKMEPKEKFNNNSTLTNWIIGLVNGFNLFMGFMVMNGFLQTLAIRLKNPIFLSPTAFLILGPIPIAFSFLFFFVPTIRSFIIKKNNERIFVRNKIKNMIRTVFNKLGKKLYISEMFAIDYAGDVDSDEIGLYYYFPRIAEEQTEVKQIRQMVKLSDYQLSEVNFSAEG